MTLHAIEEPLLEISGLSKTFPGVRALEDVSLRLDAGEIVAVVGHNGSGKSTLVKILAGVMDADPGAAVDVREQLHFIHQDLGLVAPLSTVENLALGRPLGSAALRPTRGRAERDRAEALIRPFGVTFDVAVPVARLTPAERTIVALARALDGWSNPGNVLVLDEPTTALHGDEVTKLADAVRAVAAGGAGVVFISHRLDEVLDLAHRVVVLRDGRVVADADREDIRHDELVRLIAGADVATADKVSTADRARPLLAVRGLTGMRLRDINLDVHAGEVVGITGVLGSGREQLAGMLFGALARETGTVHVGGVAVPPHDPRRAIEHGLAFVPGDRHRDGAVMGLSARENLTLPRLGPLRRAWGRLSCRAERDEASTWSRRVGLHPPQPERRLDLFSGGNQQKLVLAKWLRLDPKVLLLDEPTQGVDIGAKAAIYALIAAAARAGGGVLVCSSETKELVSICDRVLVLRHGVVVADLERASMTEARLVSASLGLTDLAASSAAEPALTHAGLVGEPS